MLIVHGAAHRLHDPGAAMKRAGQPPNFDVPDRIDVVLEALQAQGAHRLRLASDDGLSPIARVHRADYLNFLQTAWERWPRERGAELALPQFWPGPSSPADGMPARCPDSVVGQLGWFAGDAIAPLMAGTWAAAYGSAQVALSAQRAVAEGARSALRITLPPGTADTVREALEEARREIEAASQREGFARVIDRERLDRVLLTHQSRRKVSQRGRTVRADALSIAPAGVAEEDHVPSLLRHPRAEVAALRGVEYRAGRHDDQTKRTQIDSRQFREQGLGVDETGLVERFDHAVGEQA
jgi:hypothetical protein